MKPKFVFMFASVISLSYIVGATSKPSFENDTFDVATQSPNKIETERLLLSANSKKVKDCAMSGEINCKVTTDDSDCANNSVPMPYHSYFDELHVL